MSILSGFKKVRKYLKTSGGYSLISQWTSSQTVEMDDGTVLENKITDMEAEIDKKAEIKSGDAYIGANRSGSVTTITHNDVGRTGTTSAVSPAIGDTFTAVDSITSDAKGHVTNVNTKTVTLPTFKAENITAQSIGALPNTGGTMMGNLTVSPTSGEVQVNVQRTGKSGRLVVSSSNNFGLYDVTYGKWVVQSDASGNVTLNGNANSASSATNATNADKVDGFHASSFLGNGTGYVCPTKNGGNLNDIKTEYHGFVYNCSNSPGNYGFLDVTYFDGVGFAPYGTGSTPVVRQVFTKWDTGQMWARTCVNNSWTAWVFMSANDYTSLSGRYVLRTATVSIGTGTSAFSGVFASGVSVTVGSFTELAVASISSNQAWLTNWSYSGTTLSINVFKNGSSATTATVYYFTR